MPQPDRLTQIESTLDRLGQELSAARAALASLRTERAAEPPRPDAPVEVMGARSAIPRVDAFNAVMGGGVPPAPPATTLGGVYSFLGISATTAGAAGGAARSGRVGLEQLVGRYGTLALAALTILLGVGAFLNWAIRNGLLGPELRVALGTLAAAAMASVGWRMRRGPNRRFGDLLLALALAVMHVVAWGAGPRLHLIPEAAALAVAAVASSAVAWRAWREEEQALFNVGFGGALLAPLVTSSRGGDPVIMLAYGLAVLGAALAALSHRDWGKTPFVLVAGTLLYTALAAGALDSDPAWARANAPAAFALGVASFTFLQVLPPRRAGLMFVSLLAALVAMLVAANGPSSEPPRIVLAVALTMGAFAASTRGERLRGALLGAFLLPLGGLAVALSTLADIETPTGALIALLWFGFSAAMATRNRDGQRSAHAFTATLALGLSIALLTASTPVVLCVLLAVMGAGAAFMGRRLTVTAVARGGAFWLVVATVRAFVLLDARPAHAYLPFLTPASLAALAVSVGWLVASWHMARSLALPAAGARDLPRTVVRIAGVVVTFLWGREELARAVSPDVSTFLLVAWYAMTALVAIHLGRVRSIPLLRHVGLALSVFTAFKSIAESSALQVGWRVAAYLLAGLFLLGVAYWYGQAAPAASPTRPEAGST